MHRAFVFSTLLLLGAAIISVNPSTAGPASEVDCPRLHPAPDIDLGLFFKDEQLGRIYAAMAKAADLDFRYEEDLDVSRKISIRLAKTSFVEAMQMLTSRSGHLYRVLDDASIFIARDTPDNRQKYRGLCEARTD